MGEFLEGDGETAAEAAVQTDAAGVGIALERARSRRGGKGDAAADRFLAAQEALIAKQGHHLDEQISHLGLDRWSKRLRLTLQTLTIAAGLAVAAGVAWMAWDAAHADGLVVEAFSAPPDLAAKGATGTVVAREVLDAVREIDRGANTSFGVKTSDAFTERAKIELPETGLTLGEVQKALRDWLGHETHLTGEVMETPAGLKIVARSDAGETAVVEGPPDQLANLTAKAAEQIMAKVRPYIAAQYDMHQNRPEDARLLADQVLATSDDPLQRSLAENLLGSIESRAHHLALAAVHYRAATTSPDLSLAANAENNLSETEYALGHSAASRAASHAALEIVNRTPRTKANAAGLDLRRASGLVGVYADAEATALLRPIVHRHVQGMGGDSSDSYGQELAALHDPAAREIIGPGRGDIDSALGDWVAAAHDWEVRRAAHPEIVETPNTLTFRTETLARVGRLAEAEALAATLSADCTPCWSVRGLVASRKGDAAGSERAYAQALRLDPTEPSVLLSRGQERLRRGEIEAARADFQAANAAAPAWADPMEAWGEALLAKGDAKAAAAKFADAQRLTPRWGRLHLKWGEALAKLGKTAEAKAQFRAAAGLDLMAAERAELAAQQV